MKVFIILTFLIFVFCFGSANASSNPPSDSLKKYKFNFFFDGRKSFISGNPVSIGGVRLGIQHVQKWRIGIGLYGLNTTILRNVIINQGTSAEKAVEAKLEFGYLSFYYERILYKSNKWEISIPVQLGAGDAKLTYLDSSRVVAINKRSVSLIEPSVMAEYRFLKWAGVGVGLGLRKMLVKSEVLEDNFNAPIYLIKLKIHFGDLYKGWRGRRKEKKDRRSDAKISERSDN